MLIMAVITHGKLFCFFFPLSFWVCIGERSTHWNNLIISVREKSLISQRLAFGCFTKRNTLKIS